MKKLITLLILTGLVIIWAKDKSHKGHGIKSMDITLKAEVMDLTCYFAHPEDGQGKDHAKCAQKCIKRGLPVGIKTEKGELYVATGTDHKSANDLLGPHGGKVVSVTGSVKQQDGVKMIFVKSVKPQ